MDFVKNFCNQDVIIKSEIQLISIQTTKPCKTRAISTILVCCRKNRSSSVLPQFCDPRMKSISENKSIPVAYTCQIRVSDLQCVFKNIFPGQILFCSFCLNPKNWENFGFKKNKISPHCVVNLTNFLANFFGNIHQIFDNFKKIAKEKTLLFLSCIRHFSWHKIGFVGCVKYWSCLLRRKNGGIMKRLGLWVV